VKVINDAAMQALGSDQGGRMLFLGLGTGLGSAMVVDGRVEPLELAHLPYKDKLTYEDVVGLRSEEHTSELQSPYDLVCRLLLETYVAPHCLHSFPTRRSSDLVKVINDAAMQALGSDQGGRMLFLGLGTGLGSAMVVDGRVEPLELAHLPYKDKLTYEDVVGLRSEERRVGKEGRFRRWTWD